ncbi:MAG: M12 family metallo-peptidase [Phycisphaerales bacterium]
MVSPGQIREAARSAATFTVEHFQLDAETTVDLELQRFRVTLPGTRFVVGHMAGDDVAWDFDPDRVTLLRGRVAGEPDSHVFMALSEWGSSGRIDRGGTQYAISGDATSMTVSRPVVSGGLSPDVPLCGGMIPVPGQPARPTALSGGPLPEITQQIEIAIETDYELFQLFGDLDATGAYVVELWGAVSDIYLRDVNTRIVLSFVRLWDDPDDLFNGPASPLAEFVEYWQDNMAGVDRDVAQVVSGRRDFPYGGAAYLSALCGNFAYGVVGYMIGHFDGLDIPSVFGYDIQVTAHELGHNAGAFHTHDYGLDTCNDTTGVPHRGTIMSYCSQTRSGANANTDLRFHANFVQSDMRDHIFDNVDVACVVDDCNGNGVDDAVDIAMGTSDDDNGNGIADDCEDCNNNGTLDPLDISLGTSLDLNTNGVPDECEPDCNGNKVPDDRDILLGTETDLHGNGIPDSCETDCNGNGVSDYNEIQVDMSLDLDRNAILDA